MTPEFIEQLARRLKEGGIGACDYEEGSDQLRLRFSAFVPAETGSAKGSRAPVQTSAIPDLIRTRGIGRLCFKHPSQAFDIPSVGTVIAEGQIVGFLQVGNVLSAIEAHRAGTLGPRVRAEGDLVGFGDAVQELQ